MEATKLRSLCVFCGSSKANNPVYEEDAKALGVVLAQRGIRLVYGGGSVGLMGVVSSACKEAGGSVHGVIPEKLVAKEVSGGHGEETESFTVEVVGSMAERKEKLANASDAFIALPGGLGTLDELVEMCTWSQIGYQRKSAGVLNTNGFYTGFIDWLDHAHNEGFIPGNSRDIFLVDDDPNRLVDRLQKHETPESPVDAMKRNAAHSSN